MGSSHIGNRSLMGLLGGTRYDPHSFDGLGVGGEVLEEEEGEEGVDGLGELRGKRRGDHLSLYVLWPSIEPRAEADFSQVRVSRARPKPPTTTFCPLRHHIAILEF